MHNFTVFFLGINKDVYTRLRNDVPNCVFSAGCHECNIHV